ncbi:MULTISPECIES: class I SAM-dependent methyltransferase [unclassified Arthrobacter]|uniref:class I SAM-dependent methyltransferase n=1 Tax=unclassified Arthrobacter TaxID=235627 RepID=UPI001E5030AA|nr:MULTISPECIES: class I SAM-dependent methyltransferase [unclassified Arthrobacter]MCC9145873.1 class I SAM-dependent methyltransferase [Arthrobacter sp. zg-Y919]MDK1277102.1 class I SAM-dependent methyltransferase [Arthrobacter sp. zg.Y919]WIB03625.1 class I SAM-dependent methyltransferase [Arthrobacter sp. zg-Y919]
MTAVFPSLSTRALDAVEEMDRPDADLLRLERTYAQFWLINAVVSGWRRNYVRYLRPLFRQDGGGTLLDVGSGGGDVPRCIARWSRRDGLAVEITAIDPDPRAHTFASSRPPMPGLTFRRAFSGDLVAEGRSYDAVISNHMLHHLAPKELRGLLADSELLGRKLCLHSDIQRSRWAYALFSVGTLPFFPGSFIRADGLTSIRRSYTASELAAVTPPGWQGLQQKPWQNLLLYRPPVPARTPTGQFDAG